MGAGVYAGLCSTFMYVIPSGFSKEDGFIAGLRPTIGDVILWD